MHKSIENFFTHSVTLLFIGCGFFAAFAETDCRHPGFAIFGGAFFVLSFAYLLKTGIKK